jgi:4-amino-4-deoxy-L-arabinose transferase-like glycosyltransferase
VTPGFDRRDAIELAALFVLALGLRLAFGLWLHPPGEFVFSDMWVYDHRAGRLLSGELGPWDTFTPVGYPALLAGMYALFGRNFPAIAVVHALFGAASTLLVQRIGRRVPGRAVALISASLVAIHPALVLYSGLLLSETSFGFLLLASLWLLLRMAERPSIARAALAGSVLGLATVVRPNLLAFAPLLVPWLWVVAGRRLLSALRHAALIGACALVPIAGACVHNSRLAGRLTGPATNGGLNFYLNFAEVRSVRFPEGTIEHKIQPVPNAVHDSTDEWVERPFYDDRHYFARGVRLIVERPLRLGRALRNVFEGSGIGRQRYWPSWRPIGLLLSGVSIAFFVVALIPSFLHVGWLAIRRRLLAPEEAPRLLLATAAFSVFLTMWLFLGDPRVRVPFDPIFVLLGVDGGRRALGWLLERRRRRAAA